MMDKKGQGAMEYLMTYGWAILIVIVVGGVLYYYGVFSPGTLVGETKTGFGEVEVDQWSVSGSSLNLVLANRAGEDINITNVYVTTDGQTSGTSISPETALNSGERMGSTLTPVPSIPGEGYSSGDAYQLDVAIEFEYTRTGLTKNSTGKLSGTAS